MGIQDHLTCLLQNLYAGQEAMIRTRRGKTDWFKIGKGVWQGYILTAYLACMQNISSEMPGWMNHKLESRLLGEISATSDMQMIPNGRIWRGTKMLLDEDERGEWKSWLEIQHWKKLKISASSPITLWQREGEKVEAVTDFLFLDSKITVDCDTARKLKDTCSLEGKLW